MFYFIIVLAIHLLMCNVIHAEGHPVRQVSKVIIWGHKLHSHTHSYIHWGFFRAFNHLGYKTYWLDGYEDLSKMDFSNSLFLTEGQVDQHIPIRDDCYYIIHNCDQTKYRHLLRNGHAIILQVYTHDCLDRKEPSFDFCFHYDLAQPIIYMPWATDLLPHEIDQMKQKTVRSPKQNNATFTGSIGSGLYGNIKEIDAFKKACNENHIAFQHGGVSSLSMEQYIELVQRSKLAPAIQGEWQCRQGYIPCRIFKNISYGAMGITNSKTVYELFKGKIVYNPDSYQLCNDALKRLKTFTSADLYELMDFVRDNHTYISRINLLFDFFEMVQKNKDKK